jgi:predicted metalloprotease
MPSAYVLAHELGHELQGVIGLPAVAQHKELQADCFAGYYLGSVACRGLVGQADILATLTTACVIADGTGNPVTDRETHGTCEQRMQAVVLGMDGYARRLPATTACRL